MQILFVFAGKENIIVQCALTLTSFIRPASTSIPYSSMVSLILESMFMLAFFGFLMCSEFAPTSSNNSMIHLSTICLLNLTIHTSLIYSPYRIKTDQQDLDFCLNAYLSPYKLLTRYVNSRYAVIASLPQPLFLTETGKMVNQFCFQKHLYQSLWISGILPWHYSSYISTASTAARFRFSDQPSRFLVAGHHRYVIPISATILRTSVQAHAQLSTT